MNETTELLGQLKADMERRAVWFEEGCRPKDRHLNYYATGKGVGLRIAAEILQRNIDKLNKEDAQ